jgi:hypothetical protein
MPMLPRSFRLANPSVNACLHRKASQTTASQTTTCHRAPSVLDKEYKLLLISKKLAFPHAAS